MVAGEGAIFAGPVGARIGDAPYHSPGKFQV
jgi:hypothetical protein